MHRHMYDIIVLSMFFNANTLVYSLYVISYLVVAVVIDRTRPRETYRSQS